MGIGEVLSRLARLHVAGVLSQVSRSPRYYDEPRLYLFHAAAKRINKKLPITEERGEGSGVSFDAATAQVKAACEAIERLCFSAYHDRELVRASAAELSPLAVPICEFAGVSPSQLQRRSFRRFRVDETSEFAWIQGWSLTDDVKVALPAHLVFVPYKTENSVIRLPISTGGATGVSADDALLRGILEVAERDAFMIHYLTRTCGCRVDYSSDEELQYMRGYFKRYRLDLHLVSLPTDLPVHTVLALLIDETGIGPALSAGMKCSLSPREAALGAIVESWQSRPWLRDDLNRNPDLDAIRRSAGRLRNIKRRGLMWSSLSMLEYVRPWIENPRTVDLSELPDASCGTNRDNVDFLVRELGNRGYKAYAVDVTLPEVAPELIVLKAIVPALQPLHLDEPWVYLGSPRLREIPVKLGYRDKWQSDDDFNTFPHFFL